MSDVFTPEQEKRIREIIAEESAKQAQLLPEKIRESFQRGMALARQPEQQ